MCTHPARDSIIIIISRGSWPTAGYSLSAAACVNNNNNNVLNNLCRVKYAFRKSKEPSRRKLKIQKKSPCRASYNNNNTIIIIILLLSYSSVVEEFEGDIRKKKKKVKTRPFKTK